MAGLNSWFGTTIAIASDARTIVERIMMADMKWIADNLVSDCAFQMPDLGGCHLEAEQSEQHIRKKC